MDDDDATTSTTTNTDQKSQQCTNQNKSKENSALTLCTADFTSYLQKKLINAGYSHDEWAVHHPTFLHFMHLALLKLWQTLQRLKFNSSQSQFVSVEENKYLNLLKDESGLNKIEPKIDIALECFHEDLINYLGQFMLNSGFSSSETKESHNSFISFFSSIFLIETKKLIRYKSECRNSNNIHKRSLDRSCLTINKSCNESVCRIKNHANFPPFEELESSRCSILLVVTTKRHFIYCVSTSKGRRMLKTLKMDCPVIENVQNLINEMDVANKISCHAFRQAYARTTYQNKKSLLLEWVDGDPLNKIGKLNISSFMTVAREIASGLLAMHMNQICHMNLTCEHIIFNSASNSIKIIGCGSSSSFCNKKKYNPKIIEKDLHYISPEQTGRVNREVDFRSDFYNLGIIFYRLLAGNYPFESANVLQLVHMHILQEPSPLHSIDSNIPIPISDLISKLLNKDADERYQSAKGIMHDIDLIMSEYESGAQSTTFSLAQHDISETLLVPQKLYGRFSEYNILLSILDRIKTFHSFESLFVKGNSGSGKSTFVLELYKSVAPNGKFVCGKYDISKCTPYSGLLDAMNTFCDDILLEDELTLAKYRTLLQGAVGEEGKLLTDVVVNLHLIIGKQPVIADTFGLEAKNRFNYVFVKFIKAICTVSLPFVLVLDDLQWLDSASLDLLRFLVKSSIQNLMFIGVYRDNEINDEHPLSHLLYDIKNMNTAMAEISLQNMDNETTNDLISDSLCISSIESYSLSSFIYTKTKGSPFFVKQMLGSLVEQNRITFNIEKRSWQWDDCIREGHGIAGNVHELLRTKILSFNKYTQQAFKIASLLGSPFSLSSLKLIINNNQGVEKALSTGMITQFNGKDRYCFAHDQIQQAAFSLLPKNPLPVYLYVGKKMWKHFSKEKLKEHISVVVNLLFIAISLISNQTERYEVAKLFMRAGENAMTSTAFEQAFKYFNGGIQLLDQNCWKTQYNLSFNLHSNAAKAAYCVANYKSMHTYIEKLLESVTNTLGLVLPYLLLIRMYSDKRMYEDAISTAVRILNKLGEEICLDQNESTIASIILQTKSLANGTSIKKILNMTEMDDDSLLSVMEILNTILFSCYYINPYLAVVVCARMIELTFQFGISKYTCSGFCVFSTFLAAKGDKAGYEYGKLSLNLLEKSKAKELIPLVNSTFFATIYPYFASLHHSLDPLMQIICTSLEMGSHHFSSTSAATYCPYALLCGKPLSKLLDDIQELEKVVPMSPLFLATHQATLNLIDKSKQNPSISCGDKFNFVSWYDKDREQSDISRVSAFCCVIAYLFNDIDTASKFIEICRPLEKYIATIYLQPIFYFYDGLVSLAFARKEKEKIKFIKNAEENILRLKRLCDNAPENYHNKVCLLEAELAAVNKNELQAISQYQTAISLSNKHGFLNEEALALERAGIFYLETNSLEKATQLLLQSFNCYKLWGAYSKMHHLIQKYPFVAAELISPSNESNQLGEEEVRVCADSQESISLLTDDASYTSFNTWRDQKRIRLSTTK